MEERPVLTVEIWSDVVCPWCYLGKRRWDRALQGLTGPPGAVRTAWRAFELRTDQPRTQGELLSDLMRRNYRMNSDQIEEAFGLLRRLGAEEGIELRPEGIRPVNSFDAHRLLRLAADHDLQDDLLDRVFRAYHTGLLNIADHDVLRRLAAESGLPDAETDTLLGSDRYAAEVRADEARAAAIGVTSVPSFVIDGRQVVHGAVEAEQLLAMAEGIVGPAEAGRA
ncbi:DsbA family oxidoreductase [Streptomyces sp. NPDC000070]|uniref:DsbA family oxidoreductase n=1 Tax=Streptomyces sp. NPDC000070 TaxID=3154240 RepID=UPI003321A9AA